MKSTREHEPMRGGERRRRRAVYALIGAMGAVFFLSALIGFLEGAGVSLKGPIPTFLSIGLVIVLTAVALFAAKHHWRAIDELARDAHKTAWYWGGSLAMGLSAAAIMIVPSINADIQALVRAQSPEAALAAGGFIVCISTLVGYLIAWIYIWMRKQ
jgi:hypothetical protein